jgi:membrane peptidoglycan carboxypeptidase
VPSVKLLYLTGVKDAIKTAKNFGISTLKDSSQYGLTLVLGGGEVTLLEMASAYGVFAQDGVLHSRNAIISVEDGSGSVLEEKQEITIPVINANIARMMNDILTDNNARVPVFSPTSSLYFPNRQIAAKTGTTQNYRDAWVIGYSPSIVAGVWVGNNNNTPMRQEGVSVMVAGPIWHEFMEAALLQLPNERFTPPEYQAPNNPALRGMYGAGGTVKIDKISGKLATENTPPELIKEVSVGEPKTILWFVNKGDPLGSPPHNPASDPQYDNWQSSITTWALANQLTIPTTPTEFDDIHTPEQRPNISLISPSISDTTLPSLNTIVVGVTAPHPLQEVTIFIDDELKGSKTNPPAGQEIQFSLTTTIQPGEHIIKIVVYDTVGNTAFIEHKLSITGQNAN